MKIGLIVLVVVGVAIVVGALLAGPDRLKSIASFKPSPTGTEVRARPAVLGTLIETISAPGEIEPHTKVQIAAEVSARIETLPFREGDVVRKGEVVAQLDDRDLKAALEAAAARRDGENFQLQADGARLEGLKSGLDFAQRELERMKALYESGDVSRREYDNALERVEDLEASVEATKYSISVVESSLESAKADMDRARDGLGKTTILAPMDGEITQLNVEVGEIVTGSTTNPGTVLMTIADRSRMVMKAQVAESDVANVEVGQNAKIYINAYPDDVFSGTVTRIDLQRSGNADGTGYFETEVEIDLRDQRIRSGHVANVDIQVRTHKDVIVVPYQAIVVRETDELPEDVRHSPIVDTTKSKINVVYRVVDGRTVCTAVDAGASDLTDRVVKAGLAEGDVVVTGPYKILEKIKDGEQVRLAGAGEEETGETPAPVAGAEQEEDRRTDEPAGEGDAGAGADREPAAPGAGGADAG